MRRTVLTLTALALTGAALTACSDGGSVSATNSFPVGDGTVTMIQPVDRSEPVALSGTTLDGARLDLASLRGRYVVLNVWGSWCAPCRKEAPQLVAAAPELKTLGVDLIGIDTRDDPALARAYDAKFKVTYPSLNDTGTLLLALRGAVPPNSIPSTLVLDQQGRVAARFNGPITRTTLLDLVSDVRDGGSRARQDGA